MIVDTSALIAIALAEPPAVRMEGALARSDANRFSAGNWVELQAVGTRRFGGQIDREIGAILDRFRVEIVPVSREQAELARAAYTRFGIGTGHPARLNFGDCFAYALARALGEPLLFVGDDFRRTDIALVL